MGETKQISCAEASQVIYVDILHPQRDKAYLSPRKHWLCVVIFIFKQRVQYGKGERIEQFRSREA